MNISDGTFTLRALVEFTVPGVHTEKLGSGNQDWDTKVRNKVREAIAPLTLPQQCAWFAVTAKWFVVPARYRRQDPDLDNFRIKPVMDSLTRLGFWEDDNVQFVRRIGSEVAFVSSADDRRLEVTIYGAVN